MDRRTHYFSLKRACDAFGLRRPVINRGGRQGREGPNKAEMTCHLNKKKKKTKLCEAEQDDNMNCYLFSSVRRAQNADPGSANTTGNSTQRPQAEEEEEKNAELAILTGLRKRLADRGGSTAVKHGKKIKKHKIKIRNDG